MLVTGAGIDGELPEALVLERYDRFGAALVHRLSDDDVEPFRSLFDWHPSEATGLLCAAAHEHAAPPKSAIRASPSR